MSNLVSQISDNAEHNVFTVEVPKTDGEGRENDISLWGVVMGCFVLRGKIENIRFAIK